MYYLDTAGESPLSDTPLIIAGEAVITRRQYKDQALALARGISIGFGDATTIGLFVEAGPALCFALTALGIAGKTCVPFDFVRHHDNIADVVEDRLPILFTERSRLSWERARGYSVAELMELGAAVGEIQRDLYPPFTPGNNLFSTRLGLVRVEFGRNYLDRYFQKLNHWAGGARLARLLTGVAPFDFIGLLEILWFVHRPSGVLYFPPRDGTTIAELIAFIRGETITGVQSDDRIRRLIEQEIPDLDWIILGGNEDVESERFRRLLR